MKIEINQTDEHNDYFVFTDDSGNEYPWHCRKGIKQNPETVLNLIRQREYPGADLGEMTWDEWIKSGCINPEISEEYTEQVTPAVFALNNDDPVMIDRRIKSIDVEDDNRKLTPELLQPAKFETKTRVIRPRKVIEKVAWKSTHPVASRIIDGKKISKTTLNKLNSATTIAKMKEVLKTILLGNS